MQLIVANDSSRMPINKPRFFQTCQKNNQSQVIYEIATKQAYLISDLQVLHQFYPCWCRDAAVRRETSERDWFHILRTAQCHFVEKLFNLEQSFVCRNGCKMSFMFINHEYCEQLLCVLWLANRKKQPKSHVSDPRCQKRPVEQKQVSHLHSGIHRSLWKFVFICIVVVFVAFSGVRARLRFAAAWFSPNSVNAIIVHGPITVLLITVHWK